VSSSRRFEISYLLFIPLELLEHEDKDSVILRKLRKAFSVQHDGMSKKTCVYSVIAVGSAGISCLNAYNRELKVDDRTAVELGDRTVLVLPVGRTVLVCQVILP